MIVSNDRRFIFIHVQKTGGLSVQAVLTETFPDAGPPDPVVAGGRHASLEQALSAMPEVRDYYSFGFVRNPWARMYSWHSMVMRRKQGAESGNKKLERRVKVREFWAGVIREVPDFEDFVLRGPDLFERLRTPQLDYLTASGQRVDFIGRTEQLEAGLGQIYTHLGEPAPSLPRRNAGPPTDYRSHYTAAMRDRVAEVFAVDIAEFGYTF